MRFKTIGQILILFLLGACLLLAGLYIGLPVIVESQLKKQLQQYNLPGDLNFHIEKIGLTHAQVSGISLNEKPVADHLDLFYALERISQLHILKVVVSGVKIHGDLDAQNKLTIEGLSLFKPKEMGKNNTTPSFFSYLPDRVIIKNSMVTVSAVSDQFYLPFDGLAIIGKQNETIDFRAHIYPFGEKISLQAAYGLKQGLQAAQAKARAFDLEHLNALIGNKPLNTRLAGKCDFNIQYSASEKRWSADLSHLGLQSGFDFGLKDITCDFNSDGQKRVFNGAFSTQYNAITPMTFAYTLVWDATKADPYHFKIKSKKTDQMVLTHASGKARLRHPQIMIDVTANAQKGMGTVIMKTGPAGLTSKQRSANSDSAVIKGSVSFDNSDNGVVFNVKPHIRLSRVTARHSGDFAVFPAVTLSGVASYNSHRGPDGSIQLDAVGGRLDFKSQQITATGIDVHIPIQFPSVKKQKTGTYRIVKALWNGQYPVSAKGKIKQLGLWNVKIDGQITSDFLKKLHPEFECIVHLDKTMEVALEYSVPPFELNGADIKRIVPEFNLDADMSMTVSANGKAGLSNHQFDTRMVLEIKEGRFEMPELKMTAKGINSRIIFNDLLTLETEPGQMMTIDQVNIDKIDIDDAKLRFSIEDAKYILLENFKFKWCKGLVSTEAIRFPNKEKNYSLILYCDRLDLAELLKQMGVFNAEGSGSLNGRIPIIYNDGEISFDNGFLFSTPGSGGKVNIINTDKLIQGIPIDSPQFAELDLAREALKDFEYKWAKLTLNTLEDLLFVNMEMDGKPANVLPFEYRRDLGRFARVDASHPGSRFQGIDLDVNLNLPFNDVMKFGNKLKSLFNQ